MYFIWNPEGRPRKAAGLPEAGDTERSLRSRPGSGGRPAVSYIWPRAAASGARRLCGPFSGNASGVLIVMIAFVKKPPVRFPRWIGGTLCLVLMLALLVPSPGGETSQPEGQLYREGQLIRGLQGTFHRTGDRFVFHSSDGRCRLVVLENLALERVDRALNETLDNPVWTITGTATEFRGRNYLLLQTAFLVERP